MKEPAELLVLYFVVPLWVLAGWMDWMCHRRTDIEHTAGAKESAIHLLMFAQMGVPVLAGLFLEINALVLGIMMLAFVTHEATAYWDLRVASRSRYVSAFEQRVHSYLELLPLAALLLLSAAHWPQVVGLFGMSSAGDFSISWKEDPLATGYLVSVLMAVAALLVAPFGEEFYRCRKALHAGGDV